MNTEEITKDSFQDNQVNVKLKLATLWVSFMFLYIYVDYFHLFMPNKIDDILKGKVFVFEISQVFLLIALILVTVPVLMIFLSVMLSAKANRITNIIVAMAYIPYMLFNLVGEIPWMHMVFGAVVEVAILCQIIRYAWKWPRNKTCKI